MENGSDGGGTVVGFLKEKGLQEEAIERMLRKCSRLEGGGSSETMETAKNNWDFLERELLIPVRKLPSVISRCPPLLVMGLNERLLPMVNCLRALGIGEKDLAAGVSRFPHLLTHSVEEKLCPMLAFLQGIGVKETNLPRILIRCPRLLSYSIERKLAPAVRFLSSLGLGTRELGRVLTHSPNIVGYSIESRLLPTVRYLQGIGLNEEQLRNVGTFYPHILCREADRALRPGELCLRRMGFSGQELAVLVGGFPPVLTKSVRNSLEPKMHFLEHVMGRSREEVVGFPSYFRYSLHHTIEKRFRKMREQGVLISLSEMLGCNQRKFAFRIGMVVASTQARQEHEEIDIAETLLCSL